MPRGPVGGLLSFLQCLPPAPDSDAALLDRFARERDADAFAALVARHGPMVFAVCLRALRETNSAEDAFQAVFVALARDAGRVRTREALSGWLYRVALRVSRRLASRSRASDALPIDVPASSIPDAERRELLDALDDEVNALPDRLRTAVVLCALEGRSNTEAAALLGCPVGTVDSRLHTAKRKLLERLTRRGFGLPAIGTVLGGISLEIAPHAAAAARLTPLILSASTGGPLAPGVAAILQEMKPVSTHFKLVVAVGVGLLLAGAGFALHALGQPPPPMTAVPPNTPPGVPNSPDPQNEKEKDYQNALVAAIHRMCDSGFDAEHLAVLLERHPKLINERVTHKGNRKPSTTDDFTALHWAARSRYAGSDTIEVLIRYKADVNATDGAGWTPLHLAAERGDLRFCELLVKAGAKIDAKTVPFAGGGAPSGGFGEKPIILPAIPAMTPLDVAKNGKHTAVIEYLSKLENERKPRVPRAPNRFVASWAGAVADNGIKKVAQTIWASPERTPPCPGSHYPTHTRPH